MPRQAERVEQLTEARCDALQPKAKRYRVTDAEVRSLKLVIEPSGRKFWSVRYVTREGKASEKALGEWPAVLPKTARLKAAKVRGDVISEGVDPVEVERVRRQAISTKRANTFEALAKDYLAASRRGHFSGRRKGGAKAESTLANEEGHLKKHALPALGSKPMQDIRRRDIIAVRDDVATGSGNGAANKTLEVIRRVFAFALDREVVEFNLAIQIPLLPSAPRDVLASDGALRTLWDSLERDKQDRTFKRAPAKPSEAYATAAALQVALLTLQRRGEVVQMRKPDVDLKAGLWVIPAMNKKERRKGGVPLSAWAKEIIEEAMARNTSEWVFPGAAPRGNAKAKPKADTHLKPKTVTRYMARLRENDAAKREAARARLQGGTVTPEDEALLASEALVDITPHDLRRTGRTKLTGEELHIDSMTAERVLNHSVGTQQQRAYDWNEYLGPKRIALEAWSAELRRIVYGEQPASNVREIRERSA